MKLYRETNRNSCPVLIVIVYFSVIHCLKSVCIRSFSGLYFLVFSPNASDFTQWLFFTSPPVDRYRIYYIDSTSSGVPLSVDTTNLAFTLPNLSPGTTYRYWIIPYSKGVAGPKSKEFTVKMPDGKFSL